MRRRHILSHRRIWAVLALLLPAILLTAALARQNRSAETPVRVAPP
jgi:hypothetical protein